jgi:MFS transporter, MHS family, citrate/tricarballylate:H+ symporter
MTHGNPASSKIATVLRVTSGNFLEMFDFFLFGFYATYIAKAFFPVDNELSSLMLTFMTFGAGFLMRPLGAIFLGAYVDKIGRRKGLITTLSIMALGTILIAFVPGYETIGLLAPFLVLVGRLLQGSPPGSSWAASRSISRRWPRPATRASTCPGSPAASRLRSCSPP